MFLALLEEGVFCGCGNGSLCGVGGHFVIVAYIITIRIVAIIIVNILHP